jgi:hypothetical protein
MAEAGGSPERVAEVLAAGNARMLDGRTPAYRLPRKC